MPTTSPATTARRGRALLASVVLALAPVLHGAAAAQPAPTSATHTVQPGETLWQIATAAGLDVATLAALNDLADPDAISAGQMLRLAPAAHPPPPAPPPPVVHTVAEGETLWQIATQYGVAVDALVEANGLENADLVVAGAALVVPGAVAGSPAPAAAAPQAQAVPASTPAPTSAPVAAPAPRPAGSGPRTLHTAYIVQPGETLSIIARQLGTTPAAIAQASGLEDINRIGVGQSLKVPIPAREHVVQPGETLYGIAARERVDLGVLIDFNEIADPQLIRVGEVLVIPGLAPQVAAQVTATPEPTSPPTPAPATPAPTPAATPAPSPTASGSAAAAPAPPAAATATTTTPAPRSPAASPTATPIPPRPRVVPTIPPGTPTDGLVGEAVKHLGRPYVFGGSGPGAFDCSGFVWYVSRQVKKPLPRGLLGQYNAGAHPARDQLKPGDLVFFQNTYMPGLSHNGIYLGHGQFIHASDEQSGVTISSLDAPYWASRYFGATRLG